MTDHTSTRLDPDAHLTLEQPLLRLPHELLKKNLKCAQRAIEPVTKACTTAIQSSTSQSPAETLASLDATLAKSQNLKRKLEALRDEEKGIHRQQKARIAHLQDLHEVGGLADVRYERWSKVRLDRLLVDYLLRQGFTQAAKALAAQNGLDELVDVGVFEEAGRIESALRRGDLKEALAWCNENRNALKKGNSELELELRLQQLVELVRTGDSGKLMEAVSHARKYFAGGGEGAGKYGLQAGGLLAFGRDTFVEPYATLYAPSRYPSLSTLFTSTHRSLFSLPSTPILHIALSAGLSALKTPACHSKHALAATSNTGAPVCPICSTELNDLAKGVPYAHHSTSHMEEDAVALPNGRVFGRRRLRELNEKLGTEKGWVRDPTQAGERGTKYDEGGLRKVYIS